MLAAFWQARVASAVVADDAPDGAPRRRQRNNRKDKYASVVRVLNRLYGDRPAADFGCRELAAVRQAMIEAGWCRGHINQQITRVRAIFKFGIVPKLVPPSVVLELEQLPELRRADRLARETRPVEPVLWERALAIVPHVSAQVAAMVKLQLETGMRSTEVCIMRPCDIDRSKVPWEYRPAFHKTEDHDGAERVVMLHPAARDILTPFLLRDPSAFCFQPREAEAKRRAEARAKRDYIPPSQIRRSALAAKRKKKRAPGDRYTHTSYLAAVKRGCELAFGMPAEFRPSTADRPAPGDSAEVLKAKADRRQNQQRQRCAWLRRHAFHPHQSRHAAGFRMRGELGLEATQLQLGHKTSRMTERYAPPDARKVAQVIESLGSAFHSVAAAV